MTTQPATETKRDTAPPELPFRYKAPCPEAPASSPRTRSIVAR